MTATATEIAGRRCIVAAAHGPLLRDADDARELIEAAFSEGARLVVVPVARLDPEFFRLRSGLAGAILQKMVNYRLQTAIVGDISAHVAASDALRDFVIECERGSDVIFAADMEALAGRLRAADPGRKGATP